MPRIPGDGREFGNVLFLISIIAWNDDNRILRITETNFTFQSGSRATLLSIIDRRLRDCPSLSAIHSLSAPFSAKPIPTSNSFWDVQIPEGMPRTVPHSSRPSRRARGGAILPGVSSQGMGRSDHATTDRQLPNTPSDLIMLTETLRRSCTCSGRVPTGRHGGARRILELLIGARRTSRRAWGVGPPGFNIRIDSRPEVRRE